MSLQDDFQQNVDDNHQNLNTMQQNDEIITENNQQNNSSPQNDEISTFGTQFVYTNLLISNENGLFSKYISNLMIFCVRSGETQTVSVPLQHVTDGQQVYILLPTNYATTSINVGFCFDSEHSIIRFHSIILCCVCRTTTILHNLRTIIIQRYLCRYLLTMRQHQIITQNNKLAPINFTVANCVITRIVNGLLIYVYIFF
jgi:hypothetical protein